jgi:hypothetical protein
MDGEINKLFKGLPALYRRIVFSLFLPFILFSEISVIAREGTSKTFLLDLDAMKKTKELIGKGETDLKGALQNLIFIADTLLNVRPVSVMDKTAVPPSGDKHDYMSVGPYWWPDPESEDGLPYIRRDGLSNPERGNYDSRRLKLMQYNASILSLAYFYTDNEAYAGKAAEIIKVWFLNPSTRMNPNLNYAQAIPGRTEGRGIGIIDTRRFGNIIDATGLLESSGYWSGSDTEKMKEWFRQYLNWLLTSDNGIDEAGWYNNHGTWYDAQTVHIALFTGDTATAETILKEVPSKRIDSQIEPDGSQPHELKRTRSFVYSTMNLKGMFRLAILGEHLGINLWEYESEDGRGLKKAFDYLIPYALQEKKWEYEMIRGWEQSKENMYQLMRIASYKYHDNDYELLINKLGIENEITDVIDLTYPAGK